MTFLDRQILAVLMPAIKAEFDVSDTRTAVPALGAWAVLHYAAAGRTLEEDLRRRNSG